MIHPDEKLGRLAVLKPYRGYGLGKILVKAVHDWVEAEGHKGYVGQGSSIEQAGTSRKVTIKLEAQVSDGVGLPGTIRQGVRLTSFHVDSSMRSSFTRRWAIISWARSLYVMAVSDRSCACDDGVVVIDTARHASFQNRIS